MSNPVVTIISPLDGSLSGTWVVVTWSVDDVSGTHHTEIWLDDMLYHTVHGTRTTMTLNDLAEGHHSLRVVIVDWKNHSGIVEVLFEVFTLLDYVVPVTLFGLVAATTVVVYVLKRRRS